MKKIKAASLILAAFLLGGILTIYYLKNGEDTSQLVLYGNVDVREVDIGFRVSGQVDEMFFQEGDSVEPGDLLAILNKSPYDSKVALSKANVVAIEAQMNNALTSFERRQVLVQLGGVSEEDLEDYRAKYLQLQANLEAAKAELKVDEDYLSFTQAYAPTKGVILTRVKEPGAIVQESDPVYTISIASPVWIRAYVNEPQLGDIKFGMEVKVYTDIPKGKVYTGRIGFISPVAEFTPKTVQTTTLRTDLVYRLRIYIDDPDTDLKQGMPVTAKVDIGSL